MKESNPAKNRTSKERKLPLCPVCGLEFKYRVKRSQWLKVFLFWYPVKRYFCGGCMESYYITKPQYAD